MKIVINIPEEEYRWIKGSDKTSFADVASKECMLHAIKNGVPLPKGHGNLIDVDSLIGKIHGVRSISAVIDAPIIIKADKEVR